jgi:branched-chain amino acid transport system permease protein
VSIESRRVRVVALVVLAALALLPLAGDPFAIRLATRIMIYGLAALSLDLLIGITGLVSFGHAAYFGLGAYVIGIGAWHGLGELMLAWPLAILVSGLAALLIGAISLRTSGVSFIMITLAFAQMLFFLIASLRQYGADDGLGIARRNTLLGWPLLADHTVFFYVVLAILALALWLGARLAASRFGVVLQGIRQNERRMLALGFATYRYKLAAFTLAGAIAGLAGALLANHALYVSPQSLHWTTSGELIVMVLLGGMGSLIGPVLGAAALLLAEDMLSAWTEHWQIFLGPLLLLVVLYGRRGILGVLGGRGG